MLVPLFSLKNIALGSINISQMQSGTNSTSLQSAVDAQAKQIAEDNISQLLKNCCFGYSVTPLAIHVEVKDANGKMSVESAEIVLKSSDMSRADNIKKDSIDKLGVEVKIKEGEN